MRSSWKLIPTELPILRHSIFSKLEQEEGVKLWLKGFRLFSDLSDKKIFAYNGGKFVEITVKKDMSGNFLGCFVLTKRITADIHSKTKRNKKGRLNKHKKK